MTKYALSIVQHENMERRRASVLSSGVAAGSGVEDAFDVRLKGSLLVLRFASSSARRFFACAS
jgi:hypothetical protein